MVRREQENRKGRLQLDLASLSIHGSEKFPIKSHPTLTMTVQSAMTDLSQLNTVLQLDIEGKSRLFSRCPPVLIPVLCSESNSLFLNMKQNYIA